MEDLKTKWVKKMFNAHSPKQHDEMMEIESNRLRKDEETSGGQPQVNPNAKPGQGEQQSINEGLFKPKEEKGLFDTDSEKQKKADKEQSPEDKEEKTKFDNQQVEDETEIPKQSPQGELREGDEAYKRIEEASIYLRKSKESAGKKLEGLEKLSTYGKNNKIVTEDVAVKTRERLRKKLGGELRTGIDPEMM